MTFDWSQGALAEGLLRYEAGEYFAAHEAWESLWLESHEPDKRFLQGLIQITAAFHHLQRNNQLGAVRLLQAALLRLEQSPPHFGGLNVVLVCDDIRDCIQKLKSDASLLDVSPIRIRLSSSSSTV